MASSGIRQMSGRTENARPGQKNISDGAPASYPFRRHHVGESDYVDKKKMNAKSHKELERYHGQGLDGAVKQRSHSASKSRDTVSSGKITNQSSAIAVYDYNGRRTMLADGTGTEEKAHHGESKYHGESPRSGPLAGKTTTKPLEGETAGNQSNTRTPASSKSDRDQKVAHESGWRRSLDSQTQIECRPNKVTADDAASYDPIIEPIFEKTAGADAEIDAFELQQLLTALRQREHSQSETSVEACRRMIAFVDRDRNGKLNFKEFRDLWRVLSDWRSCFKDYDKNRSSNMNAKELREALSSLGFKLSADVLSSIVRRYANKKDQISEDDFIQICCRVKSTYDAYLTYQGKSFSLDDFILSAIYT